MFVWGQEQEGVSDMVQVLRKVQVDPKSTGLPEVQCRGAARSD